MLLCCAEEMVTSSMNERGTGEDLTNCYLSHHSHRQLRAILCRLRKNVWYRYRLGGRWDKFVSIVPLEVEIHWLHMKDDATLVDKLQKFGTTLPLQWTTTLKLRSTSEEGQIQ